MIRINQLKLSPIHSEDDMRKAIKHSLKLSDELEFEYKIVKRSIDARHKPEILYVYAVNVKIKNQSLENKTIKKVYNNNVMLTTENKYTFPCTQISDNQENTLRPIIIGFGPAGMFCALFLARCGLKPIVVERGQCVEKRLKAVNEFWNTNELNINSNVQFGEGGAGTFSDGKLNTMIKDPSGRIAKVLETFVEAGADSSILYNNKPHIGTDVLCDIVRNIRKEIISLGGEVRFNTCLEGIDAPNNEVKSIHVKDTSEQNLKTEKIDCDTVVMAIGHSARDTFAMIHEIGIEMVSKSFAVGLRIEHPQAFINYNTYGDATYKNLPVADYKVTYQAKTGRGVYSFCMCPGGYVVNASSEKEMLAINGMSYSRRDSKNANSALIVTVTPQDFDGIGPLAGIEFQRKLERAAYKEGKGSVPVQLVSDFIDNRISTKLGQVTPCIKGSYEFANIRNILPEYISQTIIEGLDNFGNLIKGYNMEDAVLSGIESRTSSPVRIIRNDLGESSIKGLFPCGEGAGYAGGITSAAIDGIKTAEKIAQKYIK
ncbi:NAD(P)/FAD-dependent oxidoreductase [[Clostridium] fimetarium]|uniref:FAD-dependent protein C-terminal domain-containing protein n=1 Tax=[Clostridium] fimetarium TaxID=99656 RepID=A0A1I0QJM5_9FIRM|nr:FAD-dependent oxidoreductase [[Clostridium] fimetarium]SEW27395.1 hypothetical protein SAMN05421659_10885 [[Clostridium] fimetarium]